jgi:hypothetical protein
MAYTKVFGDILTSTVWLEDSDTRVVWLTMLAMADQHGEVMASVPGLAHTARVPVEACRAALDKFMSPDPDSRTETAGGRRIEKIDGGWALINHAKYRAMASKEDRKEKTAERNRRYRQRNHRDASRRTVTPRDAAVTQDRDIAEAEEDSYGVAKENYNSTAHPCNSVANATGEQASPKATIFQEFLPWMNQRAGKDCRGVLGSLCSTLGDDDALSTLRVCREANPVDPIGWIKARMRPRETNDQRKDREIRDAIERSKMQ